MSECSNCDRWEEKYKDLLYDFRQRGYRIEELQIEVNKVANNLDHAEYRIRNELEPRIKREQRSYDSWVTSGGSGDECYQNGMNGHCGCECSVFGSKWDCFENVNTEEEILNIYENYKNDGLILNLIEEYGLEEKAKEIDRECLRERINKRKEYIEEYKQDVRKWEEELLNI